MTAAIPNPPQFKKVLLRGFAWAFTQSVGGLLAQIGAVVILSRLLTPADFGVVAIAISVVGVVSLVVELGVGPALIQQRELNRRHVGSAIWISVVMAALLMAVCQFAATPVAALLGISDATAVLRFLTVMIALQPLVTILSSLARREFHMRAVAVADLVGGTFGYGLVAIVLALLGAGYWALAIAQISQLALTFLILLWTQRRRISFRAARSEARDVLSFGAFFSIGRLANYAAQKFDRALVGGLLGADAAGHYQRVLNMLQLIGPFAAGPLDAIMFPLLSRIQDDASRLRRSYRATTAVAALLTMPASAMMSITAPVLVPLVLGSQWFAVVVPAQIMAGMLFFRTNDSVTATLVRAVGRVKERAALQVLYAGLSLGSIYLLQDFGLPGIATGLLCVTILNFLLMSFLVRRVTSMSIADNFTPLLPGALAALALILLAGVFYLLLGDALFTLFWTGSYIVASAIMYLALLVFLPAACFPGEVVALRSELKQFLRARLVRPKRSAVQLEPAGRQV